MKQQISTELFEGVDGFEFEERADYLPLEIISKWSPDSAHFRAIQRKLTQVGAKLLIGPRGAGKTHYMRHAYQSCLNDKNLPLPLYISFNHYLRLETYIHETSNAIEIFHAWVLAKIVLACNDDYNIFTYDSIDINEIEQFIIDIEKQNYKSEHDKIITNLNIESIKNLIDSCASKEGRKRSVLFFDDAALTLTKEYMVEFFDIFRSIKTARISPKASVYPGTTQYGPRFHVGQDAEPVMIWQDVDQNDYINFMQELVRERFNKVVEVDNEINQLLIYASFGIPRAYINLVRAYTESSMKTKQAKFNSVIEERCKYLNDEYMSIIDKLPQYNIYIKSGWNIFHKIVSELKEINHTNIRKDGLNYKKTVSIGIEDLNSDKIERVVSFLIEAGLLYELPSTSHGVGRTLRRFIPHYAFLIKEKVFSISRGFSATNLAKILTSPSEKHPLRRTLLSLINKEDLEAITLTLPNCSNCGAKRLANNQKFCHQCGNQLIDESAFRSCMKKNLLELPLTDFQMSVIKQTNFKTVEDVISSKNTATEFMKVKQVAQKRAAMLEFKVRTWVNEFLA
ncbi:TPA: zinc ribbon domain-containing protein [Citrobacter freundii]|uniref:zinc ribbon domain-containing protein n=1 Tax=Citrobacter braakii TaxID=57706 RepID=UPI001B980827|nr:zinc ribbon domain-containing protein [Salmonella enterica subsp. enterica serovar Oranienburg]EHM2585642.1 zinc ribbon domain-containing protein [Salmonella enterica subsp. enterica serovar Oranienburg]HBC8790614.1 zinc ribbon domain-containing protein [Citrobacter braakii]HCJ6665124.1 zinc ribbon domain-containing protein [Citrobacter freundii]